MNPAIEFAAGVLAIRGAYDIMVTDGNIDACHVMCRDNIADAVQRHYTDNGYVCVMPAHAPRNEYRRFVIQLPAYNS